jgi:sugar phosphate isomerase/epimerase
MLDLAATTDRQGDHMIATAHASPQRFQAADRRVAERFRARFAARGLSTARLALSWSNWMFGSEPLARSAARLARFGIRWIELHGNHYGPGLGYEPAATRRILGDHGIQVAGVCGMFSAENDLSSSSGFRRQAAIDYLERTVEFCAAVGGRYVLTVPGAVGRPRACDQQEAARSAEALRSMAETFAEHRVRCAIEPIRADEVSFCHTVAQAKAYIAAVDHPWVRWINGDTYHLLHGEGHVGEAILEAGDSLANLHLADTNRGALGEGMLDLDAVIMSLYAIGFQENGGFVTPEPLGVGADPYARMHGAADPALLDRMVERTVAVFTEREGIVRTFAEAQP